MESVQLAPSNSVSRPTRLFINNMPDQDWLIALEFGRVDEGQAPEAWQGVTENFGFMIDQHEGRIVGFKALEVSQIDLSAPEYEPLWSGVRFCAPTLALADASAAEVILAARAFFGDRASINRYFFSEAIDAESVKDEVGEWLACVETGDCMAHYGLGVALMNSGSPQLAYKHLRFYTSIAPMEAWAQYWYAQAAIAVDNRDEARVAVRLAVGLASDDNLRAEAGKLLGELEGR